MANTKQGIYYPDNYNSVADVPRDMKKMAESIDTELETDRGRLSTTETNIQSLQTDNTTNKKNISDIKQEQTTQNANIEQNKSDIANINEEIATINEKDTAQDTNIETLTQRLNEKDNQIAELEAENEDLKADLSNSQIHGKASGEYVHLSDSAKMNCDIAVLGNSRQETETDIMDNSWEQGDINSNTGVILASTFTIRTKNYIAVIPNIEYRISRTIATSYMSFRFYDKDYNFLGTQSADDMISTDLTNATKNMQADVYNQTVTILNTDVVYMKIVEYSNNLSTVYKIKADAINLNYPSEIESVSSANVKVCNKNLFDNTLNSVLYNACTKEITNSGIRLTTTKDGGDAMYHVFRLFNISNYTGKTFTLKSDWIINGTIKGLIGIGLCDENGNNRKQEFKTSVSGEAITYTIPNKLDVAKYICVWLYANFNGKSVIGNYIDYTNIQLELNETSTDYISHEEQNYTVDMQEEMLEGDYFDLENGKEVHNWQKIIFDGTEEWILSGIDEEKNQIKMYIKPKSFGTEAKKVTNEKICICTHLNALSYDNRYSVNNSIAMYSVNLVVALDYSKIKSVEEFKAFLQNNNVTVHYKRQVAKQLDLTATQTQQLQALQKAKTYKNITNITTDTIAVLDVDYKRDLETYQKQQDDRITAIEQLLSTTTTSAMLLDNVQTDLESEVK